MILVRWIYINVAFDGENTKIGHGGVVFGYGTSFSNHKAAAATDTANEISRGLDKLVKNSGSIQSKVHMYNTYNTVLIII